MRKALLLLAVIVSTAVAPVGAEVVRFNVLFMDGGQSVPPVTTAATGSGSLLFDTVTKMLAVNVTYRDMSSEVTKAHIHGPAAPGNVGSVQYSLTIPSPLTDVVGPLSPTQEAELFADLYYINVHTLVHGPGEIRGQITRDAVSVEESTWGSVKALFN